MKGMPWKRLSPYLSIGSVVIATLLVTQCKVDKLLGPPTGGVLTLNPLALADSAPLGSTAARTQRLIVGNGATGRITWTASTAHNSAWLHLGAAAGTAPDTLPLSFVPTGLALGTYRDTVIVTGSGSTEGALRVPVQFTVQPCVVTPVTVGAQVTGTLGGASCGAPHRSNHPAALYSFNGSAGDSVSLELTAPAGYLVLDSTNTFFEPSYSESGTCAGIAGNPCLYYQRLPRTGSYVVEVTTNTAADSGTFTLTLSPPRIPAAPTTLTQLQSDSATVVNTGDTVSQNALVFKAIVSDPDRPDSLRLEVEAKPTSIAFAGTGTTLGAAVKNGQPALVRIGGLADDSSYHWRARAVDQTGRVGPWLSYGGNGETAADFVLGNSLAAPSALKQLKSDAVTTLPVGATNITRALIFSGLVTDPVQNEPVHLEIEYEPVGTAFTNVANAASTQQQSPATAQATGSGLVDNVSYHWQAREVSQSGRTSGWVSFGGNAESAADFKEALTPQQLVFVASPSVDTAGAPIHPTIQVAARDSLGNTLASFHDTIAIVIDSNPGGSTLSGTAKVAAVSGVASFPGLSLDKTGIGYRLRATLASPALTVQSGLFNVTSGTISSGLTTVAAAPATIHASKGDSLSTITVTVKDPFGNPVPNVTVVMLDTATGDSLRQPAAPTNASGVATGSVSAKVAGVKTISATAGGQAITQAATVTVLPAHAQNLTFTVQPTNASAGATISPAVQVTAKDSLGNVDTSYSGNVTVAIGTNPGGATLGGTKTVASAHGIATFASLTLDKTGTGYTLTAAGVGVAVGATSTSFNIGAGAGTKLAFTIQPTAVVAGAAIAPAIEVTAEDGSGNTVSSFTGTVTLSLGANPGSDTLGGTISVAAVGGKATFSSVILHHVGAGYTLAAAAAGFTGATSSAFNVRPGAATQLAFTTQPAGTSAGGTLPATVVTAQDAFGNTDTTYHALVTAAIDSNPGGGVLGGTTSVTAVNGVATFSTLTIDKAGIGYRLAATATGLTRARSNPFSITAGSVSASLSTVIALPGTITAGGTGSTISVTARDSHGNPIAGATVVLASSGTGNTLTQPAAVTDSTGLATGSITSTKAESKTISATVGGVLVNQTASVVVNPGAISATQSTLGASPTSIAAGGGSSVITATARDAFGNAIASQSVVLAASGTGNTVTQPPSPTDASGIATGALSSTVAGSKVITATIGGVAITQTDTVAVTPGAATHLVFTVEPTSTTAGAGIAPTVQVSALDANNNVSTGFAGLVTLAIGTNPGGGTLLGTASVSAVAGVSSFPGVRIDPAGTGYTLTAASSGLAGASSSTFNILTGPAAKLGVATEPSAAAVNGTAFAQQPVIQIQDSVSNPVSQSGTTVTAATGTGAGTIGGTLTAITSAGGQAAFTNLKITGLVGSRTLSFTAGGLAAVTSSAVVLSAGPATQIAINGGNHQAAPAGSTVVALPSVLVTDQSGNPDSGVVVAFTLPGSAGANGSLTGPNPTTNASGIATVGSWTLGTTAKPDSMTATSGTLTGSPLTFVDTAKVGAAASIVKFSGDSLTGQVGKTLLTPHDVLVKDANGNGVPNVTVTWAAQSGGSVSPTSNLTDATGHAQATRTLGNSNGPETTTATATLGSTPTAVTFNVTATTGGASQMKLSGGDLQKDTVGVTLPVALSVQVQDSLNNPVSGVTISWTVLNGGGSVSAPTSVTNGAGIASINWTLGTAMSPVDSTQLVQAAGVASPITFTAFTVPGAVSASQTSVTATSPIAASSGSSQSTVTVTARDQYGNVIKGKTVTLASTGTGNTVINPAVATNTNGVTTGTLSSTVAEGKTVTATVGSVTITQQASVVVNPAAAASLNFVQQPTNVVAGASITPAITVEILDAFSNQVTAASNPISLTLASNPGSSTLSGSVTNVAAVSGVATFANASLNKNGTGYTLSASSAGLTGQTSTSFNVTSGLVSAAQSTVSATSPITAGGAASTITVTARDGNGNPVAGATVVLAATGVSNTLTQPGGVTDASGVATGSLASTVAESKTVSATINGVGITQAPAVVVNPGAAQNIALNGGNAQSATVATTVAIAPSVIVKDVHNNPVPGVAVTFAVTGGGGTVDPATQVLTNGLGIAQVTSWTLGNTVGANALTATATGLSGSPVSISATGTPGTADHFAFTQQPTNAVAGSGITPTVTVAALDTHGNVATSFAGSITLTIAINAGGGALSGTTTVPATNGVASFPGISIDKAGTGYTLTASNTGPTPATSAAFNITPGTATHLVFSQQPTNAASQAAIAPGVTVTALDASDNVATGFANAISLSIASNAGGGALTGGAAQTPVAGVSTFSALSIDKVGTGYTLSASATGVTGSTSSGFNITPGAATKLAFTVQPSTSAAGVSIAPAVQVTALDAAGNTATGFNGSVSVAIGNNPGGATLQGTAGITATAGMANFSDLSLTKVGAGYTLTAAATSLSGATSNGFDITPAPAASLVFTTQPASDTSGGTLGTIQVTARDGFGNTATGFATQVTLTISNNAGGGTLTGTAGATPVSGVASFPGLSIDKSGTGYTLSAAATGVTGTTSSGFNVTAGNATHLVFTGQPSNVVAGAAIAPAVQVTALDANGNVAATAGADTIRIGTNPGGSVLSGDTVVARVSGASSHVGLTLGKAGTGYTLTARSNALTGAVSTAFNVTAGVVSAAQTTVSATSPITAGGTGSTVTVTARDGLGNPVVGATVVLGVSGTNNTITQPGGVTDASGIATGSFTSTVAESKTVSATVSGVAITQSPTVVVNAGTPILSVNAGNNQTDSAGGTLPTPPSVIVKDALNNPVAGIAVTFTVTASNGTVTGGSQTTGVNGIATMGSWTLGNAAKTDTLTVMSTAGSATFLATATPGHAASIAAADTLPSSATVGASVTAPSVRVTDSHGNHVSGVNVTFTVTAGGGSISPTSPATLSTDTSGRATLTSWTLGTTAGADTVSASSTGLTGNPVAFTVTGTAGAVSPTLSTVGATTPITASSGTNQSTITVTAKDASGNPIAGATVVLAATGSGDTLTQPVGTTNAGGVATGSLASTVAESKTVTAKITGVDITQTATVVVNPATATQLVFTGQPLNDSAGGSLGAIQVTAHDPFGNTAVGFTGTDTITIASGPSGAVLSGTVTAVATAGVANFGGLSINKAGAYTLGVKSGTLTPATSAAFNVGSGVATVLTFTTQPTTSTAGTKITPTVSVTAQDAQGNTVTTFTGTVTLSLSGGTTGAHLRGTTSLAATSGVASFPTISVDSAGAAYTMVAAATGLTSGTSAAFNIRPGSATQLAFRVQPTSVAAGVAISPAVVVSARDSLGNRDTTYTGTETVTIGANPGSGTLTGGAAKAAVAGLDTFPALSINKVGSGYTLAAAATGLTGATSSTFDVSAGAVSPTQSTVTASSPITASTGSSASTVTVTVRDASGNPVPSASVVLADTGAGTTLNQPIGLTDANGVATGTISATKAGTKLVSATANTVAITQTAAVVVNPATPSQLVFTGQPVSDTAGGALGAVQVTAEDQFGNLATAFTGTDTIAIGTNPGSGVLAGTTVAAATAGVATFPGLSINKTGTGYTLSVKSGTLPVGTSALFNITSGSGTTLVFTAQPVSDTVNGSLGTIQVTAQDAQGNTVNGFTGSVALAIGTNPSGGTLSGTTPVTAVAGVATFTGMTINNVGTGYTLNASSAGLTGTGSSTFNVTPGNAATLVFTAQPVTDSIGGSLGTIQVTARDAQGNTATGFGGQVALAIGINPSGGTLSGTTPVTAASGVATFTGMSIDKVGAGYTLNAASTGVTGVTSSGFNVTAGNATTLTFTAQPVTDSVGGSLGAIQVTARDAQGNTATGFAGSVSLAVASNPGGGTLTGTTPVTAVSGVATFPGMSVDKVGTGYTLSTASTGLTGATSSPFNVTSGNASALVFTSQPVSDTAAGSLGTIQVTAQDAHGNIATGFTGSVSLAIGSNPGGGTLSGVTPVDAVTGVATFSGMSINKAGTGYTLSAASIGLTGTASSAFNITAGAAANISISTGDGQSATVNTAVSAAPAVLVTDASGNPVAGVTVTFSVATGGGSVTAASPTTGTDGIATLGSWTLGTVAGSNTLTAAAGGFSGGGNPVTFTATGTAGAATQLVFTVQPTNTQSGHIITPAVVVTAEDVFGNTDLTFTGSVAMAIGSDPNLGLSTFGGTTPQTAVAGVATFGDLTITFVTGGNGYTLQASSGALTITSNSFNITP
ncbi:MAG TPA: Ig-like domain-containing protein [Gemmatimonadales bacterium]|nr:Ig-like domain-containing protein [Gemmatimonadales bacterium]